MNQQKSKIGVAGVGYVGGAVKNWFEKQGNPVFVYDKFKQMGSPAELNKADVVFLCLPTPFHEDGRGFDDSALWEILGQLEGEKTLVIKSTILPGSTEKYQKTYPSHRILFNPEFLVARTADDDFLNPDRQVLGVTEKSRGVAGEIMAMLPKASYQKIMLATEAEMVKYFGNVFLSNRVIFGNEMYDICAKLGIDYETVKGAAAADQRIGPHHFDVHHEGYRGYGGMCLPKDTRAFIQFARGLGHDPKLFQVLEEINARLKNQKPVVVAVSGGFDPLHFGHVRLFKEARKLGDKLVVILNNDNWLRKKKGQGFMPEAERKEVLEALVCVDQVVLSAHPENSEDMSVCAELAQIRPDIFANGGDRTNKNIPEFEVCRKMGCRVAFGVGGDKIQSSSWLLAKVNAEGLQDRGQAD